MNIKKILLIAGLVSTFSPSSAQSYVSDGKYLYGLTYFGSSTKREAIIEGLAPGYTPSGVLTFPDSVEYEGRNYPVVMLGRGDYGEEYPSVIRGCKGITGVHIPNNLRSISEREFIDCPNIEWYEVEAGNKNYKSDNGSLIERFYDECWYFFRYPSAAKARTFCVPVEYSYILPWAFAANNHLKVLQIVGDQSLFSGWQLGNRCIESIDGSNHNHNYVMEDGALYWGHSLEYYCPGNVKDIFTPRPGTTQIENGAFCEAPIGKLVIAGETTKIGTTKTFWNSDIETLELPEGMVLENVGESAFQGCRNLKSVPLGCNDNGVLNINSYSFYGCESLETITFAPETKTINTYYYSFAGCKSLTAFPATSKMKIAELRRSVFEGCESLTSFPFACVQDIDDEVYTGYQFAGTGLTQVNWPSTLPVVPPCCFKDCKQLKKVNLKMSTTKLGSSAFRGSGLTALSMMGVKNYYDGVFSDCPDLIRLYFPATDGASTVYYWGVPFIADGAHVVVNNPNISGLDRQKAEYGASLYISMVNCGVKIGDGWSRLYVPGRAGELYRNITSVPVEEMYTYETYPAEGTVVVDNLLPGIKITSVVIEGREAVRTGNSWHVEGITPGNERMNVTVNYSVYGNPMNSTYEWVYTGVADAPVADADEKWYNLSGLRVDKSTLGPGVYIRVADGHSSRVLVR